MKAESRGVCPLMLHPKHDWSIYKWILRSTVLNVSNVYMFGDDIYVSINFCSLQIIGEVP